mgnify:CR=1 FL=1
MESYTIDGSTLTIQDPEAFGFDRAELENPEFSMIADEFLRTRRTYNIHRFVMQHVESGRFFAREYSTHEDEGFEWSPGEGHDCTITWKEVFPHQVTTTIYK